MPNIEKKTIFKKRGDLKEKPVNFFIPRSPKKAETETILNRYLKKNLLNLVWDKSEQKLLKKIESLDPVEINKYKNKTVKAFAEEVIRPELGNDKELLVEYKEFKKRIPRKETIENYLNLDKPIDEHPAFGEAVKITNTYLLLKESAIKNNENKINKVINALANPGTDADSQLEYLVKKEIVTSNELKDIKFTLDLGVITVNQHELVAFIKSQGRTSLDQLIEYTITDWENLIKQNNFSVPDEFKGDIQTYAKHLDVVVTSVYPTKVFFHRNMNVNYQSIENGIKTVQKFLKNNPNVKIGSALPKGRFEWNNVSRSERTKIKENLKQLTKFGRRFKYLGILDTLNSNKSTQKKLELLEKQIKLLDKFLKNNPELDLQTANFHPQRQYVKKPSNKEESRLFKIKWDRISKKNKPKLISQLKEYQRLFFIYPHFDAVLALLDNGLTSSLKISSIPEKQFITEYKEILGDENFTRKIHNIARNRANKTALLWANVKDTAGSRINNPNPGPGLFNNLGQDVVDYVKNITGYQEVFGEIRLYECPHCRSMYGPAAYFVDLLRFIDEVIPNNTLHEDPDDPNFKPKRSDLKKIELTCENTNTIVPYVELVNELMEKKIDHNNPDNSYSILLNARFPLNLPFNLHLESCRIFLKHFKTSIYEIFDLFSKYKDRKDDDLTASQINKKLEEQKRTALESLNISLAEFDVLSTSYASQANQLKECFGLVGDDPHAGVPILTTFSDVKTFLKYTKISRVELGLLLGEDLEIPAAPAPDTRLDFYFNKPDGNCLHIDIDSSMDPPAEVFINMSKNKLDRIHRFIRLAKRLKWSFEDLEWILMKIGVNDVNDINDQKLIIISKIERLRRELELPIDVLSSFWSDIKNIGKKKTEGDDLILFEKIFKSKDTDNITYDFTGGDEIFDLNAPSEDTKNGLLASLEVYENDFSILLDKLKSKLGPQVDPVDNHEKITLTQSNLSMLYRFCRFSKALDISVREFLLIWEILDKPDMDMIEDVEDLLEYSKWMKESDWSIYELHYVIKGEINEFIDPGFLEENLRLFLIEQKTNLSEIEKILDPDEKKKEKQRIANEKLSTFFSVEPKLFGTIAEIAAVNFGDDNFIDALINPLSEDDLLPQIIVDELEKIKVYNFLVSKLNLDKDEVIHLKDNTKYFRVSNLEQLKIEDIKNLVCYKELTNEYNDTQKKLLEYLYFDPGHDTRVSKSGKLAEVTQWSIEDISNLYDHFWPHDPANEDRYINVPNVAKIKTCIGLSSRIGIKVKALITIFDNLFKARADNLDDYEPVSKGILEILEAKYDESKWEENYKPLKNRISELKRDALSSYIAGPENIREIYKHLLVDPEMGSCFGTSRIKFAISSLQLYFQRCLMNLEKDKNGNDFDIDEETKKKWLWRKNYRVWEANRKVFLYPENYIFPELRHDKSPEYKELEDELLQGDITKENVEKAYKNYIDKFTELANLTTSGAYFDQQTNILHMIGRTKTEPYKFYYRTYDMIKKIWSWWEKIDLTISSPWVTPIYVYGRIFIFWLEERKGKKEPENQNQPEVLYKKIKFSYQTFNKKWSPPQLLNDQDITVDPSGLGLTFFPFKIAYPYKLNGACNLSSFRIPNYKLSTNLAGFESDNNINVQYPSFYLSRATGALETYKDPSPDNYPLMEKDRSRCEVATYFGFLGWLIQNSDVVLHRKVLNAISTLNCHLKTVHNSDGMYIFDTGNEEYLTAFKFGGGFHPQINELYAVYVDIYGGSTHAYLDIAEKAEFHPTLHFYANVKFTRINSPAANALGPTLFSKGIDEFLSTKSQDDLVEPDFNRLGPVNVEDPLPQQRVFPALNDPNRPPSIPGACGSYYEELFFHIPFLIANSLNSNQKFEDAQKWYHYIFDPTSPFTEVDTGLSNEHDRFWRYLPFRNLNIETLKGMLEDETALVRYNEEPFKPHAIAQERINAYQKTIVMKYIDNLLDWGDYLFAQDSIESINEATNLYILAYDLLGKKPAKLGESYKHIPLTYSQLEEEFENSIPEFYLNLENEDSWSSIGGDDDGASLNGLPIYFCVPENEEFLEYWERVEDRLSKIRQCMNIKGLVRKLPLFQPPISPMALVKAAASGMDLSSVVAAITSTSIPHYRFTYMIERSKNFTSMVQNFGSSLLSALEKKDAEELSLMRALFEKNILKMTTDVKEKQKQEAEENIKALKVSKKSAEDRNKHYKNLIKKGLSANENLHIASMMLAWYFENISNMMSSISSTTHLIPTSGYASLGGYLVFGGEHVGSSIEGVAKAFRSLASYCNLIGNMSSTMGGYERRKQGWELEEKLSQHNIEQIAKQIDAAKFGLQIAEKGIEIHKKNSEQNDAIYNFLKDKFTNKDLYRWMANQLSGLYFQAYKLAYDFAKSAEGAYQYERNTEDSFINFGHWDSLRKGLLAGERLILELNQLEKAYIDDNKRLFEIEKTIPLSRLEPLTNSHFGSALLELKNTGETDFELSETLFDWDFPGHYNRKIKSMMISIPAVVGPYENIKATLTQTNNWTLIKANTSGFKIISDEKIDLDSSKTCVRSDARANQQIAISRGVNDNGMFELNFRDERYLPFEGTGAVSRWKLEIPKSNNPINFDSITDVIIQMRYTSDFDGAIKTYVEQHLSKKSGLRMISIKHEFSTEWHRFMNPGGEDTKHEMNLAISDKLFPQNIQKFKIIDVLAKIDLMDVDTLYLSDRNLNIGADFKINLKINKKDGSEMTRTFKFQNNGADTVEKSINLEMEIIDSFRFTVERTAEGIPSKLRKKRDDGSDEITSIGGVDHYSIDHYKVKNIGLVLTYKEI